MLFSPKHIKTNITQNRFKNFFLLSAFLASIALSGFLVRPVVLAATGINEQISFQGKVVNTNGTNVTNGSYTFLFCLYTTSSPATPCTAGADNDAVWRESKSLTVTDGIFLSNLGDTTTLPGSVDFNTDNIYLGINFNSDGQMTPLVRFTAAPYALNAAKVGGLTVTDTTGTLTIPNGKTITFSDAFTTTGAFPLTLTSTASTTATLPSGTITLVDLATSQSLTNKTIGSTGLTFSGATTDITTATNEDLTIVANGTGTISLNDTVTAVGTVTLSSVANDGAEATALLINGSNQVVYRELGTNAFTSGGFATTALDNLASVAINTSLISDTNNTDDLGSDGIRWKDLFLGPNTLHVGTSSTDEGVLSYNTTSNIFNIGTDSTSNGDIAFFTDDLYLDKSTGFVGINDTTPNALLDFDFSSTSGTNGDEYGANFTVSDTGIVNTGTDNTYGQNISVTRTGATGGTIATYGLNIAVTGDTGGTSSATGIAVTASGADTNTGISVVGAAGTGALITSTTGKGLNLTRSLTDTTTSNSLVDIAPGYVYTTGTTTLSSTDFSVSRAVSASGASTTMTDSGSVTRILYSPTISSGATTSLSGVVLDVSRVIENYNFSVPVTVSGAVMNVTDTNSADFGTITNTADVLRVSQFNSGTTGATLNIANFSVGPSFRVNDDGSFTDSTPFIVDASGNVGIGNDTTPVAKLTVGASDAFQVASTGGITFNGVTADISTTAGEALTINSGTTGDINIGTDASAETINIGNTGAAVKTIAIGNNSQANTITIGDASVTGLSLTDNNWSVTAAGVASFITGSSIGSQTFTTNNIADSGALTIKSATTNALTLDSGTTGTVNIATGTAGKAINIGTDNTTSDTIAIGSALDNVAITGDQWSITDAGVLTVVSCSGCGGGGATLDSAYTAGNTIGTDSGSNVIINLADVATPTEVTINNLDASGTNALQIDNSTTLTNGLFVEQSAAGTLTNALHIAGTAGTITTGLLIADGAGAITNGIQLTGTFTTTILDTPSIDISGAGAITGATGVSTTTLTSSGTTDLANAGASNVTIATTGTGTVAIGNATGTFALTSAGGLNVTTGGALTGVASIDTIATSATGLTFAGAGTIASTTTSALTLDSGTTGTINLGTGNNAKTIAIGTGTAGNIINIGTNNAVSDTIAIGSALDNVAITGDQWSVTDAGVLTVVSCTGCGGGGTVWSGIGAPTGALSLSFDATETSSFAFNGFTTETGFALSADAGITSGELMDLTVSAASGFTGSMLDLNLSDATGAASNTGNLLKITNAGTANANTSLLVNHYATGTGNLAFRVDDVASDTTPFVIDGAGSVGIGTAAPSSMLDIFGTSNMVRLSYDISNYVTLASDSAGNLLVNSSSSSQNIVLIGDGTATDSSVQFDGVTNDYYVGEDATDGFFHIGKGVVLGTTVFITADSTGQVGIGDTTPNALFTVGSTSQFQVNTTGAITASTGVTSSGTIAANGGITLAGSQSFTAAALAYIDLGAIIHNTTAVQGLRLPQAASATPSNPVSGEGYLAWDTAGNQLIAYNGASWSTVGGGSSDLQTIYGNDADGSNATISLTAADDGLVFTNPTSGGNDLSAFVLQISQQNTTAAVAILDLVQASNAANGVNLTANAIDGETGLAITTNGLTSGSALTVASSSVALTGNLAGVTLSGSNAANTGNAFAVSNTGVLNTGTSLLVQHNATGTNNLAVRINDEASDTTPFVIDGAGNVGVGTTAPSRVMDIFQAASAPQLRLSKDLTYYSEMTVDATGDLLIGATGSDIRALSENVWVCDNDACPALTLTGDGNIFVENVIKFGNGVYMKNDSATELGVYDNDDQAMLIFDEL